MANRTLLLTGILILLLGGFTFFYSYSKEPVQVTETVQSTPQEEVRDTYFKENQDCLSYKEVISARLEKKDSPFGKASLEQIFYSPKVGFCVYVEYTQTETNFFNRRLLDVRNDGESSEPLTMCSGAYPSPELQDFHERYDGNLDEYYKILSGCNAFDTELEEYK